MSKYTVWECQIGGYIDPRTLLSGSDLPMRQAVDAAYQTLTGQGAKFLFSGWGSQLSSTRLAVVENRELTDTEHAEWQYVRNALEVYPNVYPDISRKL